MCENCIPENELNAVHHIILDGPFDNLSDCSNSGNSMKAFFSISNNASITNLVIKLTDQNLIDSARRQINGLEPKKYVRGNIINSFVWYNPNYQYHIDPSSISFYIAQQQLQQLSQDTVIVAEVNPAGEPEEKRWRCLNDEGCLEVNQNDPRNSFYKWDFWTKEDCEKQCCQTTKNTYEIRGKGCDTNCNTTDQICGREWCLRGWQPLGPVGPDGQPIDNSPIAMPSTMWFCQHCQKDPFRDLMFPPNSSITTPYDCLCKELNNCDCLDLSETWDINFQLGDGSKCFGAWCSKPGGIRCSCYDGSYADYLKGPTEDNTAPLDGSLWWGPFQQDFSCTSILSNNQSNNVLKCNCEGIQGDMLSECHHCDGGFCIPNSLGELTESQCKYITRFEIEYLCDGNRWRIISSNNETRLSPPHELDQNLNPVYIWGLLFFHRITTTNEWIIDDDQTGMGSNKIRYVYYRIENPPEDGLWPEVVFPLPTTPTIDCESTTTTTTGGPTTTPAPTSTTPAPTSTTSGPTTTGVPTTSGPTTTRPPCTITTCPGNKTLNQVTCECVCANTCPTGQSNHPISCDCIDLCPEVTYPDCPCGEESAIINGCYTVVCLECTTTTPEPTTTSVPTTRGPQQRLAVTDVVLEADQSVTITKTVIQACTECLPPNCPVQEITSCTLIGDETKIIEDCGNGNKCLEAKLQPVQSTLYFWEKTPQTIVEKQFFEIQSCQTDADGSYCYNGQCFPITQIDYQLAQQLNPLIGPWSANSCG